MKNFIEFIKKEAVLTAALFLAIVSMFFVTPDAEYLSYVDWNTMGLLFCLMVVMAGLQNLGVFRQLGEALLGMAKNSRQLMAVLVFLCFFSSMLITNDVALITFVPFAIAVLKMAEREDLLIPVVVLQTVAANLGSMLTPIGNPQNLYLYSQSGMGMLEFVQVLLPYAGVAFALIVAYLEFYPSRALVQNSGKMSSKKAGFLPEMHLNTKLLIMYLVLFAASLLVVSHVIPCWILMVMVVISVGIVDRQAFAGVDYSLLLTFIGFFVFIGNMGRIPVFYQALSQIIQGNELVTAVAASQVISNVPAALLLSGFTESWSTLLIGCNLGGLGTLIASMASLISYKAIARDCPEKKGRYLLVFTTVNLAFLAVLLILSAFLA